MLKKILNRALALFNGIRNKFNNFKIGARFTLIYCLISVFSILMSNVLFQEIYSGIALNKVSEVSIQTLYSIRTSLNITISNISNYSKMIISDDDLQILLRRGNMYSDLNIQKKVGTYLNKLTQETPYISSVYIFDASGNEYSVGSQDDLKFIPDKIQDAAWYKSVLTKKGSYILSLNGGGAFRHDPEDNFISMIRLIRDINTTEALGVLIINISANTFKDSFANITSNYTTDVTILDQNNHSIIKSNGVDMDTGDLAELFINQKQGFLIRNVNNTEYLLSYLLEDRYGWKIVSAMPVKELSNETSVPGLIGFAIIMINSVLLFIGTIFTSRMITIPIKKLLKSMKGVEKGEFNEVSIKTGKDEIGQLRDGYNIMIREIQNLIKRVITEQKVKRKAELNVLQAQIKPHFLYNTLDSINSLALMGETTSVCNLVEALGSYYRISLSKGKEVITIGQEIDMAENYLKIQKMRYPDLFTAHFILDEKCNSYKILKLVLQPLVENSLYHGIRNKDGGGVITLKTEHLIDSIRITIEDDGIGMSKEYIDQILGNSTEATHTSFGLKGTIERLSIFYGTEDCFHIESEEGIGTRITILIPVDNGNGEYNHA